MEIAAAYNRISNWTAAVFERTIPDQMAAATPCDNWDVHALMAHVVEGNRWFAAAARGEEFTGDASPDLLGDDPAASYRASADAVMAAMATDGAADRILQTGIGELPGSVMYGISFTEQLLHGWDLAKATHQDTTLDPELVALADAMTRPAVESGQAGGAYAPPLPVPDNASAQVRYLALVGRTA